MLTRFNLAHSQAALTAATASLALCVALVDYLTGSEIRLAPFYFIPIAIAAVNLGPKSAKVTAVACTVLWAASNLQAGLQFSSKLIWAWDCFIEAAAFWIVAVLVSQLQSSKARESELARIDRLTGLLNVRAFHEQAPMLLALCHRQGTPIVMAYIDLDNFKSVNDTHGHQRGDDVLRDAAHLMKSNLRSSDLLSRFGGDEFAVLLPHTTMEGAAELLERIRLEIEIRMISAGCNVTASIGAVTYLHAPGDLDSVIRAADQIMYSVKRSGKNRVHVERGESYNPTMQ